MKSSSHVVLIASTLAIGAALGLQPISLSPASLDLGPTSALAKGGDGNGSGNGGNAGNGGNGGNSGDHGGGNGGGNGGGGGHGGGNGGISDAAPSATGDRQSE